MKDNKQTFVLQKFIEIMYECRRRLVEDVLHYNHDLYNFLCADKENIRQLYKQRYELKWLELHFKKFEQLLDGTKLELATPREVLKIFLQQYLEFSQAWNYKTADIALFTVKIKSLDTLIQTEKQWTEEFNQMKTSFMLETKALDKLIEETQL